MKILSKTEKEEKPVCIHWWDIEPPTDKECRGVCRYCGEVRMFPTWPTSKQISVATNSLRHERYYHGSVSRRR